MNKLYTLFLALIISGAICATPVQEKQQQAGASKPTSTDAGKAKKQAEKNQTTPVNRSKTRKDNTEAEVDPSMPISWRPFGLTK